MPPFQHHQAQNSCPREGAPCPDSPPRSMPSSGSFPTALQTFPPGDQVQGLEGRAEAPSSEARGIGGAWEAAALGVGPGPEAPSARGCPPEPRAVCTAWACVCELGSNPPAGSLLTRTWPTTLTSGPTRLQIPPSFPPSVPPPTPSGHCVAGSGPRQPQQWEGYPVRGLGAT